MPNYPRQKYHDHACFLQANNRDPIRQAAKGAKGGQVRGEQMKAASQDRGYRRLGNRVHEHRWVAEFALGRDLLPGEVVHHEDENKRNNHPSNLVVFPDQAGHARHHKLGHLGQPCDCECIRVGEVMPV